jgi:dTDP-4-dehydrorhamnose reductase
MIMKNYLPKLLITGSDGQVGNALRSHENSHHFQIIPCNRELMDITHPDVIEQAIAKFSPDIIVNTAAYTAVDKAENDVDKAMLINHSGARHLATACKKHHIPLIHLSTDYIFDGEKSSPYLEDDAVKPINIYGESKWLGEQAVREQCEKYIILRVSAVFSKYGNNFLKTMLRLGNERKELNVVADQITSPTYAGNIATVIYSLAGNLKNWGTYHYCDAPLASWHQFASAIIKNANLPVEKINAITTAEYPTPAKRPAYSVLNCSKLKRDYGIHQADWTQAVATLTGKSS